MPDLRAPGLLAAAVGGAGFARAPTPDGVGLARAPTPPGGELDGGVGLAMEG